MQAAVDSPVQSVESPSAPHLAKSAPPSKNRVWDFSGVSYDHAWFSVTQPVESHRATGYTPTKTVSGRPNGNVSEVIDSASGENVAHYEYGPFGEVTAASGDLARGNPFRFSSKYWDDETGLGYWGYRYYSPGRGRWLLRDPIEEKGFLMSNRSVIVDVFRQEDRQFVADNDEILFSGSLLAI